MIRTGLISLCFLRKMADEYFVLGDNRNDSMDSRMAEVGPIVGERIIGRAWLRIYPFDQIGFLKHGS